MIDRLQQETAALRALAARPATPERRAAAASALRSKFEGVQAAALDAIGQWGGRESVDALRGFLIDAMSRTSGWAIRSVAVRNLIPLVGAEDAGWVLDLYFGVAGALVKHELVRLVIALPPDAARARLVAELRSPDRLNRQAAVKAVGNMAYPDRRVLLWPLRDDPDAFVSKSAQGLTMDG